MLTDEEREEIERRLAAPLRPPPLPDSQYEMDRWRAELALRFDLSSHPVPVIRWPAPKPTADEIARAKRIKLANDAYYAGGVRVMIDGAPERRARIVSDHMLRVLRGQSNTKELRSLERKRFAQVTYETTYVASGWALLGDSERAKRKAHYAVVKNRRLPEPHATAELAWCALIAAL